MTFKIKLSPKTELELTRKNTRGSQHIRSGNTRFVNHEPNDFYATEPKAVELLLEKESFTNTIWEPAVGQGHIANVLKRHDYNVISSDLIDRGYEETKVLDIFDFKGLNTHDIVTNPPYKIAKRFIEHLIEHTTKGTKIAMFLKLTFLESQSRREFFRQYPPKTIYVASGRLKCAKNGEFEKYGSSAVAYAWFIWEVGYKGKPSVEWIN